MQPPGFEKIKAALEYVWKSPYSDFYRKKYEKAGFAPEDIRTYDDFLKLPFLTRDDLASTPPQLRLYHDPRKFFIVSHSSGTSQKLPVVSLHQYKICKRRQKSEKNPFSIVRDAKSVLFLNHPRHLPHILRRLYKQQDNFIVVGDIYNLPSSAFLAAKLKIHSIVSTFSAVVSFFGFLKAVYDPAHIKRLYLSGDTMTLQRLNLLRNYYPNARIYYNYSLSETRILADRCEKLSYEEPQLYHTFPERVWYEILGDLRGELVITHLDTRRAGTPLIRYQTGDMAEVTKRNCECGRSGELIKVLGRIGSDMLKVAGAELRSDLLEKAIFKLSGVRDFQIHVYEILSENKLKPKVVLELVADENKIYKSNLENRISRSIHISPSSTFMDAVEKGIFLPLEIRYVADVTGHKKVKIINHIQ